MNERVTTDTCKHWLLRAYVDSKIAGHYVCGNFGGTQPQVLGVAAMQSGLSVPIDPDNPTFGRVIADLENPPTEADAEKLLLAYQQYKAEARKKARAKKNGEIKMGNTTASIDATNQIPLIAQDSLEAKVDRLLEIAEKLAKVWGCK